CFMSDKKQVTFKRINFKILSDRDRLDILAHINRVIGDFLGNDPYIDRLHPIFCRIELNLEEATVKVHSSERTVSINCDHSDRQELIKGIHKGIEFFKTSDDTEEVKAARMIEVAYNRYLEKLADHKKRTLTAAIRAFLKFIDTPEMIAAIDKILLTEKVSQLTTLQDDMDQLIFLRAKEDELDDTPSLKAARNEMYSMVRVLEKVLFLNLYEEVAGFEQMVLILNGRIGEIVATAKALHTMEENGHMSGESSKPEVEPEVEEELPEDIEPEAEEVEVEPEEVEEEEVEPEEEEEEPLTRDDR
ncbi:MAG: hypothetical protein GY786_20190, partial [Proteobacteria bacterium]|nr:hypothetical protein [Pseudomonadota bacterium]